MRGNVFRLNLYLKKTKTMNRLLKTASIFVSVFLISCINNKTRNSDSFLLNTDSVKTPEIKRWTPILDKEDLKIEANSSIKDTMIQSVKVKFEPYIWFEDFPAKTFDTISKAPLDFSTNHDAKYYITAIKNGYKEENSLFGGHYELIMWGCGSPCAHGVIVDRRTGRMVHLPMSQTGYEFRDHSLMLIVNPTDEKGFYDLMDEYVDTPGIYVFDEVKKEFKMLETKGK